MIKEGVCPGPRHGLLDAHRFLGRRRARDGRGHRAGGTRWRDGASRAASWSFPRGKGSTVGSYTMYRLARAGMAPAGIINGDCEPIVAVGAIISGIPMVDQVDITEFRDGDSVSIDGEIVTVD